MLPRVGGCVSRGKTSKRLMGWWWWQGRCLWVELSVSRPSTAPTAPTHPPAPPHPRRCTLTSIWPPDRVDTNENENGEDVEDAAAAAGPAPARQLPRQYNRRAPDDAAAAADPFDIDEGAAAEGPDDEPVLDAASGICAIPSFSSVFLLPLVLFEFALDFCSLSLLFPLRHLPLSLSLSPSIALSFLLPVSPRPLIICLVRLQSHHIVLSHFLKLNRPCQRCPHRHPRHFFFRSTRPRSSDPRRLGAARDSVPRPNSGEEYRRPPARRPNVLDRRAIPPWLVQTEAGRLSGQRC